MARRRVLSEADKAAWTAYARLVAPLLGQPPAPPPLPLPSEVAASPVRVQVDAAPTVARVVAAPALLHVNEPPGGLDRGSWNRLRAGKLMPARTLDLHGRTAQSAFHALHDFLRAAQADRVRCVEIITGRGSGERGGVLRREVPVWLNLPSLRPLVLAASHPHPANPGAIRVLLRRPR